MYTEKYLGVGVWKKKQKKAKGGACTKGCEAADTLPDTAPAAGESKEEEDALVADANEESSTNASEEEQKEEPVASAS